MKANKILNPGELAKEVEKLIADMDKLNTEAEISDWLINLYIISAKLTITQKACRKHRLMGVSAESVKGFLDEYPSTMVWLHQLAEEKKSSYWGTLLLPSRNEGVPWRRRVSLHRKFKGKPKLLLCCLLRKSESISRIRNTARSLNGGI